MSKRQTPQSDTDHRSHLRATTTTLPAVTTQLLPRSGLVQNTLCAQIRVLKVEFRAALEVVN
jgi:hypothetical protein